MPFEIALSLLAKPSMVKAISKAGSMEAQSEIE